MNLLEVDDVSFAYRRKVALQHVTFSCDAGVNVLLGPNGSGKTTLLRLISGSLRMRDGSIVLDGRPVAGPVDRWRSQRSIGWLPQSAAFVPGFTTRDYVSYAAWLHGVPRRGRAAAVERALERVRLADRADDKLSRLSGGMLRRAAIAATIVHEPRVLLLDEPTTGLDPEQRAAFHGIIRELADDACILVSTHSSDEVGSIGETVLVLSDGQLRFAGSLDVFEQKAGPDRGRRSPVDAAYLAVVHDGNQA